MEFFENERYTHKTGQNIHRKKEAVFSLIAQCFLLYRYTADGITEFEIATIITQLKNISGSDYDTNKSMLDARVLFFVGNTKMLMVVQAKKFYSAD